MIHANPITTQWNILDTKAKVYTDVFFSKWKQMEELRLKNIL